MLSSQQSRQLAEIAGSLTTEDPALARALSRHRFQGRVRWWRVALAGLVVVAVMGAGLILLAIGLRTGETAPTAAGAIMVALMPLAQMLLLRRR